MRKRLTLPCVVVMGMLAILTAVAGPATAAPAVAPGSLTLCAHGGYDSRVEAYGRFEEDVPDGQCMTFNDGTGGINIALKVSGAGGEYIGTTVYNDAAGLVVVTVPGPSFYAYVP
jgi:hypothetical protein